MFLPSWVHRGHIFKFSSIALGARNPKMKAEIVKELNSSESLEGEGRGAKKNQICGKIPRTGGTISKWEARGSFLSLLMTEAK